MTNGLQICHHLKADKEMIVNRFRAVGISEAIENSQNITKKVENSFKEFQFFSIFVFLTVFLRLNRKSESFSLEKRVCCVHFSMLTCAFSLIIQKQFIDLRRKRLAYFEKKYQVNNKNLLKFLVWVKKGRENYQLGEIFQLGKSLVTDLNFPWDFFR